MAEVLLFHHALGLTAGCRAFADELRAAGHVVNAPDLFEGKTFTERADGTCSPTTACPTTTKAPRRCSSDAC